MAMKVFPRHDLDSPFHLFIYFWWGHYLDFDPTWRENLYGYKILCHAPDLDLIGNNLAYYAIVDFAPTKFLTHCGNNKLRMSRDVKWGDTWSEFNWNYKI